MTASIVQHSAGSQLAVAPLGTTIGNFANDSIVVAEVRGLGFSADNEMIDVTHLGSPDGWREYVSGNLEPGEINVDLNYLPDDLAGVDASPGPAVDGHHEKLIIDKMGAPFTFRITWPDATYVQFDGSWMSLTPTADITSQLTANAVLKVKSELTFG